MGSLFTADCEAPLLLASTCPPCPRSLGARASTWVVCALIGLARLSYLPCGSHAIESAVLERDPCKASIFKHSDLIPEPPSEGPSLSLQAV